MTLLDTALHMRAACLSVVPARPDGSKAPAAFWKQYQTDPPSEQLLNDWFSTGAYDGLGVITGTVSGNLEMLEVEGRALDLVPHLGKLLIDSGFETLWIRLCAGYLEQSPSGGWHWLYRVDGPPGTVHGNTKLARRPGEKSGTVDVLIETRGEGGFTVTAPSAGRTHPSGRAWTLLAGGPTTIPVISADERDALHLACSTFDQMPPRDAPPPPASTTKGGLSAVGEIEGERPGDEYNATKGWDDILIPRGWTRGRSIGGATAWTRPGKDPRDGMSATTGRADHDNLYVFSTSTEFETEVPYSKFGAYTLLEHGGDWTAATKALRKEGLGREPARRVDLTINGAEPGQVLTGDPGAPQDPPGALQTGNLAQLPSPHLTVVEERTLLHSDDANGLTLVDRFGDVLRHCADRGRWYAWDGTVWAPCPRTAGPAREYAKRVARALPERNDKDVTFKKKSLSAVGITAMLTQAASDSRVAVDVDELDAHPWELNTPGGIVDLRTGQISPSDPTKLHTRLAACTPDPDADPTVWERFLHITFGGDQELIKYMQQLVGYSAVGLVGPHVLPYCYGHGGNGKGTFLETCVKVLRDYATTAPAGFLIEKTYQGHETELARLSGARMVVCSEVNERDVFDEARVKHLTGGDSVTARFMQQDHFTFAPTHQLWAMGNHQPGVRAGGPSFWRRLRLIPFVHEMPEEQQIEDLQTIMATEHGPAVLSWIVQGAVAYAAHGLQTPDSVRAATKGYARDQDTVSRFLDEMCHVGGGNHVTTKVTAVRSAYESWCRETGDQPVSAKAFGMALQRAGIDTARTSTARLYVGLALVSRDDEPADDGAPTIPGVSDPENASYASSDAEVSDPENTSHTSLPGLR